MKRVLVVCLCLALLLGCVWVASSWASRPVERTVVGCVMNGNLYSIRQGGSADAGPVAYLLRVEGLDLDPYEGRTVRVRGMLSPGDRFRANPRTLRVMGRCGEAQKRAIRQLYR